MRILLLERDAHAGSERERRLALRHEVRTAGSFAEALVDLAGAEERPELVVVDPELAAGEEPEALALLQEAAWDVPVLLLPHGAAGERAVALAGELLRELPPVTSPSPEGARTRQAGFEVEMERLAVRVADDAARRTAEEFSRRLGVADVEELRHALRLARGFESLKSRFLGAVATGLGAAFLLALANGIALLLKDRPPGP